LSSASSAAVLFLGRKLAASTGFFRSAGLTRPGTAATSIAASLVRPWLFLGPAVLALTLYLSIRSWQTLWLSFHDKSGQEFVGGANYAWLLSDRASANSIFNNFLWLLVVPAACTFLGPRHRRADRPHLVGQLRQEH
jgi:alpha-glucoside transport system permease protein